MEQNSIVKINKSRRKCKKTKKIKGEKDKKWMIVGNGK